MARFARVLRILPLPRASITLRATTAVQQGASEPCNLQDRNILPHKGLRSLPTNHLNLKLLNDIGTPNGCGHRVQFCEVPI